MSGRAKLALIAGGSGGVGGAIARTLAHDGWDVALTYRSGGERVRTVAAAVEEAGRQVTVHQVDLTDRGTVESWISAQGNRAINAVIYAAGPHIPMTYVASHEPDTVRYVLENDVMSCFNVMKAAVPPLRESKGTLLSVVTPAIDRHMKRDILSAAPKAAIQALVRGIAVEEGRFGVRSNAIGVGLLEGEGMWNELLRQGDFTPEQLAQGINEIPLRRWGDVQDIANAASFLVSDKAAWITGQTLHVDGGYAV